MDLAASAVGEGKALVIALNKIDAVEGGPKAAEQLREAVVGKLEERFLEAGRLGVLGVSATQGVGTQELMDWVVDAYDRWNKR